MPDIIHTHDWPNIAHIWQDFDKIRPTLARDGPILAHDRPSLGQHLRSWARVRSGPSSTQCMPPEAAERQLSWNACGVTQRRLGVYHAAFHRQNLCVMHQSWSLTRRFSYECQHRVDPPMWGCCPRHCDVEQCRCKLSCFGCGFPEITKHRGDCFFLGGAASNFSAPLGWLKHLHHHRHTKPSVGLRGCTVSSSNIFGLNVTSNLNPSMSIQPFALVFTPNTHTQNKATPLAKRSLKPWH